MSQVILMLASQNLPALGRRPSITVSLSFLLAPIALETLGGNSSLLSGFSHRGGSAVECRYRRCARDGILVSAHLCRYSTVECDTHTWVLCCLRPLAIPTCVFSFCLLALWHFTPLGNNIIIIRKRRGGRERGRRSSSSSSSNKAWNST